ncbi:MAG: RibD family protein, partial [Myxococcaceae bacterium]
VTLDGKLATSSGDSRWITGELARQRVHRLRDHVDAILVGAGTVREDNPQLTTRLVGAAPAPQLTPSVGTGTVREDEPQRTLLRDAVAVVLDSKLSLPVSRKLWRRGTVVATTKSAPAAKRKALEKKGVTIWTFPAAKEGVALKPLLKKLAAEGLLHVLVEGGAQVHGAFLKQKLANELWLFVAPKILGDEGLTWTGSQGVRQMQRALKVATLSTELVGEDVLLRGTFAW